MWFVINRPSGNEHNDWHFGSAKAPHTSRWQGAEMSEQPRAKGAHFLVINWKHMSLFALRHKPRGTADRHYHTPKKHRPPSSDGCGRARRRDVTSGPAGAGQHPAVAGPGRGGLRVPAVALRKRE